MALRRQGKTDEAQEEFRRAAALDPRFTPPASPKK
jgi:Tfp pilus assembly protein PilF